MKKKSKRDILFVTVGHGDTIAAACEDYYRRVIEKHTIARTNTFKRAKKFLKRGCHVKRAGNMNMRYLYMEDGKIKVEPSRLLYVPSKSDKKAKDWNLYGDVDKLLFDIKQKERL